MANAALYLQASQPIGEQMWLRQACRFAVDAAQDTIIYSHAKIKESL